MDALVGSDFSFSYRAARRPVLEKVTWSVAEGSFTLLVGATGSGKTTLLRCAKPELALEGRRCGVLEVFGCAVEEMDARSSATQIGYVAQSPENQIVCDTVWHEMAFGLENLGTPQDMMRRRVAETAHFFGIEPWFRRDTASLSGGQKQLLNLASILVMQPKLLLLDEPTAQLDPVAAKNFLHALFRINRELGITVIVATHSPETMVDYATDIACIEGGSVHPCSPDEVRVSASVPSSPFALKEISAQPVLIEAHDVFFRYARDAEWVLRKTSLAIEPATIHAIVGGNGCGKSTLLRLIAATLKPERGKVINRARSAQALLPQDPKALFVCDTVAEELAEWQKRYAYTDEEMHDVIKSFDLERLVGQHPYDTSGGQQQKIALAKIVLTHPDLLLLDEPTKGLDCVSKFDIAGMLVALRDKGKTIVVVTHDLAFVSCVADTVTMLFDGEVACTDTADDFFCTNIFYRPDPDAFVSRWSMR
ncbi:MAG: ATP-binding cassette domain-containing protein [Raoultibacter sp.]